MQYRPVTLMFTRRTGGNQGTWKREKVYKKTPDVEFMCLCLQ